MKNNPVIVEQVCQAPVTIVWNSISDRKEMKEWYFDLAEFKPEVGFEFRFSGGPSEDKQYLHICRITESVRDKKLSYSWKYDGYPGLSHVTFELTPEGNKTRLRIIHSGLETFPQDIPDFGRENFEKGWNEITGSLKSYLEKSKH